MLSTLRRALGGWVVSGVALAAVATFGAGCGGDGGGSGGDGGGSGGAGGAEAASGSAAADPNLEYVRKQVEANMGPGKFEAPGPPFDASKAKGKTMFEIPLASSIPFVAAMGSEMKKVADRFGIEYITFPNQGTPSEWTRGIDQAIARKVDLIVLQGAPDPYAVQPQLAKAKKAGIPVLVTFIISEGEEPAPNVTALMRTPGPRRLRLVSDYVVMDTEGKANVLIVTTNEIHVAQQIVPAMEDEFKTRCPDCKVKVVNVPLADWATKIQTNVQTEVSSNPELNYVIPIFDGMAQFAVAGVLSSGAKGRVSIATSDGTPAVLANIQKKNVVKMEIGTGTGWIAWANMDQAMRILSGAGPLESGDEKLPLRIFDKTNVDETGTPPVLGEGYGDAYIDGYNTLWAGE
jgi:ribose transport system substrate-binding protein